MSLLKIGDMLKDNDPRSYSGHRMLRVTRFDIINGREYVIAMHGATRTRIRADRIYTDGKPRRSGFSLVEEKA